MNANEKDEMDVTLPLLQSIAERSDISQRGLAKSLGLALGLTNAYLKRCVRKGLIKIEQIPANRYLYYLTPQGFSEKSRLTAKYLTNSFHFFREARQQCQAIYQACEDMGYTSVGLVGEGDLCEVALLLASSTALKVAQLPSFCQADVERFDAMIITDIEHPQNCFDRVLRVLEMEKIFTPTLLNITRLSPKERGCV